jgi:hypothetical protein
MSYQIQEMARSLYVETTMTLRRKIYIHKCSACVCRIWELLLHLSPFGLKTCWPIDVHPATTYTAKLLARMEEDTPREMI